MMRLNRGDRYDWGAVLIGAAIAVTMLALGVELWWLMALAVVIGVVVLVVRR
jgi:hypothetical protein